MQDKDNPTPKIDETHEWFNVNQVLKLLTIRETELSYFEEPEKTEPARLHNAGVAKSAREELKEKLILSEKELIEVIDGIYDVFDYKAIPQGIKIKTPTQKAQNYTRYTSEPISRLYKLAAEHIALVFAICPVLQERHQQAIINGFLDKIAKNYQEEGCQKFDENELKGIVLFLLKEHFSEYWEFDLSKEQVVESLFTSYQQEYKNLIKQLNIFLPKADAESSIVLDETRTPELSPIKEKQVLDITL